MKRLHLIPGRGAFLAIAAFAALIVSSTAPAQTITVNSSTVATCTPGQTNLQVGPTGDITINCTVGGTTTFSCTATANPTSIQTGVTSSTSLLSAICNGTIGANGVMWTVPPGFVLTSGTVNSQQIIVNAGTAAVSSTPYQFGVTVTPLTGTAYTNNAIPLTVTAASTGGSGGTTGCASSNGTFVKSGQFNPSFPAVGGNQTASYMIPTTFMALNNVVEISTVQNTGNWNSGLGIQIAISPCPGDFSAQVPAGCSVFSNAEAGVLWIGMSQATSNKYGAACTILTPPASNAPYYVNVRAVNKDLSPSCPFPGNVNNSSNQACSFIVQLHWGPY